MRKIAFRNPFTKIADPHHSFIAFTGQSDLQPLALPSIPDRIGNQIFVRPQQFIRGGLNP
ncbi:hypothetical protein D3C76_1603190 [compost metagenome]